MTAPSYRFLHYLSLNMLRAATIRWSRRRKCAVSLRLRLTLCQGCDTYHTENEAHNGQVHNLAVNSLVRRRCIDCKVSCAGTLDAPDQCICTRANTAPNLNVVLHAEADFVIKHERWLQRVSLVATCSPATCHFKRRKTPSSLTGTTAWLVCKT